MKSHYKIIIVAIIGIVALEIVALIKGIDGLILTLAISAIEGLAGWTAPQLKTKWKTINL